MGSSGIRLVSDRFEFFGREGDRAWVLFSQFQAIGKIREKIGDDLPLSLRKTDSSGHRFDLGVAMLPSANSLA